MYYINIETQRLAARLTRGIMIINNACWHRDLPYSENFAPSARGQKYRRRTAAVQYAAGSQHVEWRIMYGSSAAPAVLPIRNLYVFEKCAEAVSHQ